MGPGPIGPGKKFRGLRVLLKQHSGYKIDMAISYIPWIVLVRGFPEGLTLIQLPWKGYQWGAPFKWMWHILFVHARRSSNVLACLAHHSFTSSMAFSAQLLKHPFITSLLLHLLSGASSTSSMGGFAGRSSSPSCPSDGSATWLQIVLHEIIYYVRTDRRLHSGSHWLWRNTYKVCISSGFQTPYHSVPTIYWQTAQLFLWQILAHQQILHQP